MKITKSAPITVAAILVAGTATAMPITGALSQDGGITSDTLSLENTTELQFFDVIVTSTPLPTGDYAGTEGTSTTWQTMNLTTTGGDFGFGEVLTPIVDLWTFEFGGDTYSFDLEDGDVAIRLSSALVVTGEGVLSIDGFDDTPGLFSLTLNALGGTFSFSASNSTINVTEPSVLLLLSAGFLGLGVAAHRRNKAP